MNLTLYLGDNIEALNLVESESVDLIYLDPPFCSGMNYNYEQIDDPDAPIQTLAFSDTWEHRDHPDEAEPLRRHDGLDSLMDMLFYVGDDGGQDLLNYIANMSLRLLELHRVLKETGSIYLHCDPSAGHYLKTAMDLIFGREHFQNEIVWRRYGSHNMGQKRYGKVHDTILYYSKSDNYTWTNEVRGEYDPEYIRQAYSHEDERGRYTTAPLHGRALGGSLRKVFEWHGVRDAWRHTREHLDELESKGLIHWPERGKIPRKKVYLDNAKGVPPPDIITDVGIEGRDERTGYPTQKPLALLEQFITASSNVGDVVLDPFCGSGTSLVAAELLGRDWMGMDVSKTALRASQRRLATLGVSPSIIQV